MTSKSTHIFNSVYSRADFYYGCEVRPEFADYFHDKPLTAASGLDLGCGEGRYSLYLARRGCHMTGLDRSGPGLDKLEKTGRVENLPIAVCRMDIGDFNFSENSYDIIVAATILDHLDETVRERTVADIKSALKPGGVLYANVFTTADPGCGGAGVLSEKETAGWVSDTADCMACYFYPNELKTLFADWHILYYYEGLEPDISHGRPHWHGWACLLAEKPVTKGTLP